MLKTQFFDTVHPSPYYRDYRKLADDRVVLRNPHKGFYIHYVDNGLGSPLYRSCIAPGDWLADFPGLNHLYLRFDWADIERQEGVYDWSPLEDIMAEWGAHGYRFSLRLCTYEGTDDAETPEIASATPRWVYDRGASFHLHKQVYEPDYNDPVYLEYLERLMFEYARHFDGDPRIEFIDVGTFGTWGEGHTWAGGRQTYAMETLVRHLNLHSRYFKKTMILVNDDMINHRSELSEKDTLYLSEYCAGRGMGIRDDSILVPFYEQQMGYDSLKSPFMFERVWRDAPVDIERAHYRPEQHKNELVYTAALQNAHATFTGFHGDPRLWLENQRPLTEMLANRLGYWYFLEGIELPEAIAGLPIYAGFFFKNRGYAPAYRRFALRVRLFDTQGQILDIPTGPIDNTRWGEPGSSVRERVSLDLARVPPGSYTLGAGLFDGNEPVKLALAPELYDPAGFAHIDRLEVKAH